MFVPYCGAGIQVNDCLPTCVIRQARLGHGADKIRAGPVPVLMSTHMYLQHGLLFGLPGNVICLMLINRCVKRTYLPMWTLYHFVTHKICGASRAEMGKIGKRRLLTAFGHGAI